LNHESYFRYLLGRGRLALIYRRYHLYPRLCRFLNGRVLDVGCGIGDFLKHRPNTVGVDVNPYLVEHCRRLGLEAHAIGDPPWPFGDGAFRAVVLDNVLEHLSAPEPILAEIHRLLAPGGTIIVGVPGIKGFKADPDHKRFYSEIELRRLMAGAGFTYHRVLHTPFRALQLERRLSQYAIYGVFFKKER
jgi:SAM-dependent methyltransferase